MTVGAYPKRLYPRDWRGAVVIFGIAGLIGFALAFAAAWYFPTVGTVWLAVAAAQFLFSLVFSRKAVWRSLFVLILTCAAVFSAAALH